MFTYLTLIENFSTVPLYTIHLASVEQGSSPGITIAKDKYKGAYFQVTRGDYSPLLKRVNENLTMAREYAANDNQSNMLQHYVKSFNEGDLNEHKEGSRFWIQDKGPIIETYVFVFFFLQYPLTDVDELVAQ